jgi:hypothetical protein
MRAFACATSAEEPPHATAADKARRAKKPISNAMRTREANQFKI